MQIIWCWLSASVYKTNTARGNHIFYSNEFNFCVILHAKLVDLKLYVLYVTLKMHWKAFPDINEPKVLTGLNEQELLGLCAQLVGSSTVVAPKVIFRTRNYLKGGRNRSKSADRRKKRCQNPQR